MTSSRPATIPTISVGMPVYNGERYVSAAIESILAQSDPDFELIIADNASTDDTHAICKSYADQDNRIILYRNEQNIGAAANYNLLVRMARAPFFRWSNADDLISSDSHEKCLAALRDHPRAVMSYGQTMFIDEHGEHTEFFKETLHITSTSAATRFREFFERYRLTNAIYGLMRTDAVRQTNLFGDGSLPAADVSFLAELSILGGFTELPDTLFYRRMHEGASSHDREDEARQQEFWRASKSPFRLPVLRQTFRYLRYTWAKDIALGDKISITGYLARRLNWHRRDVGSELLDLLRAR